MGRSWIILAMLVASVPGALASDAEPLAGMVARAEAAPLHARPSLYAEIAERQLMAADQLYISGKIEAGRAAVQDVITYADKAQEAASRSNSRLKPTEIMLRKMAAKLRDIRRNLAFEDQAPVQEAADHLERLRTDLLGRMFGKGEK